MSGFFTAVKRYTGYARFVTPVWAGYTAWLSAHPRTTGALVIILAILAIR